MDNNESFGKKLKHIFIGKGLDPNASGVVHKIALIAFFAWVGFGSDGLTSSCYGPQEIFLALGQYKYLGVFLAIAVMITVAIISMSYSQIVELFPAGGGGYIVGTKLLSPTMGMISGCALLIDYVLTITTSIASGVDAIFSSFPASWDIYKIYLGMLVILILLLMNLRGIKESIITLVPIFLVFLLTHIFLIIYGIIVHSGEIHIVANSVRTDIHNSIMQLGLFGMIWLLLHSFSMGAGTYTGIEAVSNGINIIREPKVRNAKKTMLYMAASLAFTAGGLIIVYLLFQVTFEPGKTLNASVFEKITMAWGKMPSSVFVTITLLSEALLLFVAAQTGFIDAPNVLAIMSLDRWFPSRFSSLSDRLVRKEGILLVGGAALLTMFLTKGSIAALLVLYSISVFITFSISQLGMVIHWLKSRKDEKKWKRKLLINGIGLALTIFILISVVVVKFGEGGWITLLLLTSLIIIVIFVRNHYKKTFNHLKRLDTLTEQVRISINNDQNKSIDVPFNPKAKTAVLLVSGFNGLGLHTLFNIIAKFQNFFKNFIFVQIGVVDAGIFKGTEEIKNLHNKVQNDIDQYVKYLKLQGYYSEGFYSIGTDVIEEIDKIANKVQERYPGSLFFGGQLVFEKESFITKILHNYTIFTIQRRLYHKGIPILVMPIKI